MTILWVCLILVTLNIALVVWAARKVSLNDPFHTSAEEDRPKRILEEGWLTLGDVIFDPSDYFWLRDGVCFPDAAELLARHRRLLAIRWLRSLGDSFKELAGTPGPNAQIPEARASRLFWSALRFQFLLNYALLVVFLSGPYHRIVPPIASLDFLFQRRRRPATEI